jgi:hypothetical protein
VHVSGVKYAIIDGGLHVDFVLSNGVESNLESAVPTTEVLFRGGPHIACSYSCYAGIKSIRIFEKKEKEGNLLVGLVFTGRNDEIICDIGETIVV